MKKSLKKQAVFPVLMLLVVTALALIGSSFAWFSMNSTAKLTEVTGSVEDSSVGLMISQDATNFTGSVTLGTGAATYVKPAKFHQVSSKDAINFFEATITAKDGAGNATLIHTTADTTVTYANGLAKGLASSGTGQAGAGVDCAASYMVFDLFFSVENASTLYLDLGTTFTFGNASNKAMRVAFLDYGFVASGADAAKALSTLDTNGTTIWDPADETSYFGVIKASTNEDDTFAPYSLVANYTESVTTKTTSELVPSAALTDDTAAGNLPTPIATLGAGINKLRVVVWLEGNDPSCLTGIAKSSITFKMNFYARKNA